MSQAKKKKDGQTSERSYTYIYYFEKNKNFKSIYNVII